MKFLLVKPHEMPKVIESKGKYEDLKELVEGYIEMPYYFKDVDIVCNEEGKLYGLEPNRIVKYNGQTVDVVVGNIVVTGFNNDGETKGLTKAQIDKYTKIFSKPDFEIDI